MFTLNKLFCLFGCILLGLSNKPTKCDPAFKFPFVWIFPCPNARSLCLVVLFHYSSRNFVDSELNFSNLCSGTFSRCTFNFFSSEGISHICLDGPCRKYNIPDLKFWICIWQEPRKAQHQSNSKLAEILISCTHEFLLLIPNIVVIWSCSQHFCIAEDT